MVRRHAGREKPFRVAYGLSGTLLMQAKRYAPDLLDLWKALADTGLVEFTRRNLLSQPGRPVR